MRESRHHWICSGSLVHQPTHSSTGDRQIAIAILASLSDVATLALRSIEIVFNLLMHNYLTLT
jgi:hypothetical protein